jgi:hypothetical protein
MVGLGGLEPPTSPLSASRFWSRSVILRDTGCAPARQSKADDLARVAAKSNKRWLVLGLRPKDHEDIWLVSFMDCDLGYFDLQIRALEQDSCHSSLDAQVSGFAVDGEYLRQRTSADKDRNRLAAEFRLKTACTGKSGTNRDAKANVCPLNLGEEGKKQDFLTAFSIRVCVRLGRHHRRV